MKTNTIETHVSKSENFELFLLNLRYREGGLVEVEGNRPILLTDPNQGWIVYSGTIDIFSVPVENETVVGTRTHLFRSGPGQLLFGMDVASHGKGIALLVSGTPGSRLLRIKRSRLWDLANDLEYGEMIISMIDDWITGLSIGISSEIAPKASLLLEADTMMKLEEPEVIIPKKGILWARSENGQLQLMGRSELTWSNGDGFLPFSKHTWVKINGPASLSTIDTEAITNQESNWLRLDRFHQLVLDAILLNSQQTLESEQKRLQDKVVAERTVMETALMRLRSALVEDVAMIGPAEDSQDVVMACCRLIGEELGVEFIFPPRSEHRQTVEHTLKDIVKASRVRLREVGLRSQWWRQDNGPLLGISLNGQHPVALLPTGIGRYELVDPIARTREPVTTKNAARLSPIAYTFYRPFPNRALKTWDVLNLALQGTRHDLRLILLVGMVMALLGLLPPLASGAIFDTLIPEGNISTLLLAGLALLLMALTVGILQFTRGIFILRVQSKIDATVQAALWNHLLSLSTPFFQNYSAGDLGTRAMGISEIRRVLSGHIVSTIINSLFSITNLALLFFYSTRLALVAIALVGIALLTTIVTSVFYVRHQRKLQTIRGKVAGMVLQLLTGVIKFRVAGAEHHAFALWAEHFIEQKKQYYQARRVTNSLAVYNAIYPLLTTLVIFSMVSRSTQEQQMSIGDFLAFNMAFIQFFSAWFMLGSILVYVLNVIPAYERLQPILEAQPEVDETKLDPGELSGEIEVSHVSFRYKEKSALVLKDVSLHIKPGEFIAFVGPSGSGKSTMLRLLLGFAKAESGGVYYDNQDLADLDLQAVRYQIGVVLQNATLLSGDIYSNLIGTSSNLTVEDAWEAVRSAGFEEDIKNMPMGMHTIVSERGGNFSGGQRQRLLIARSMIKKPRILLFDEATSALDNRTQDIVSRSLEGLNATRVVIAHRLSTIINADRIYVFEKGEIVQVGTYNELVNQPGPLAELARRQIV